jgi:parallel beta-helix repeat protein
MKPSRTVRGALLLLAGLTLLALLALAGCSGGSHDPAASTSQDDSVTTSLAVNCGGPAVGPFVSDQGYNGGLTYSTSSSVDTSGVAHAAPEAVYQTERYGDFTYVFASLQPGTTYTVWLHFAETLFTTKGARVFNVLINDRVVLPGYDIFADVGSDKAAVKSFSTAADSFGEIHVYFESLVNNAKACGIEVVAPIADAGNDGEQEAAHEPGSEGGEGGVVPACPASAVPVTATDDLRSLVAANPAGTTFCLHPGVHRDFDVLNTNPVKDGDTFIGMPGAIENGATTLGPWTQVTLGSVTYWTTPGGTPIVDIYNNATMRCQSSNHPTLTCYYSQALYRDDTTYEHAYRLGDVAAGKWYYELQGLRQASVVAPGSGYSVGDVLAVAGGTGCPDLTTGCGSVMVTTVGAGGTVTGVELRALGYGYPAGPVTEATTDTTTSGSGCTVSIAGGSGGVAHNIYLASSENPNAHTVELGANQIPGRAQYLFHSTSAQNITIQGLTVEKYAGPLDSAPISCNHTGSNGTAAGWVIQGNEVLLNMHIGIISGFGKEGVPIQILDNVVHHNGESGIGAGSPASFITESHNDVYSNDTVWVPQDYGCGSIKHGGPSTGTGGFLISYNTVHDEPNGCDGLWSDVNMGNVTWDHNTVSNITGQGIRIEISGTGPIFVTNNTVTGSGVAAIVLASSSNTTVQHNNVTSSGTLAAIEVNFDGRNCGSGCPSPPSNNVISMNSITIPVTTNGLAAGVQDYTSNTSWQVPGLFDANTYCVPSSPWSATSWRFGESGASPFLTFARWQAAGQDAHGTITAASCPNPVQP